MSNANNEPAFPVESCADHEFTGMSLRDYFAAKVANGLCANPSWLQEIFNTVGSYEAINVVARASYELADAMLAARSA